MKYVQSPCVRALNAYIAYIRMIRKLGPYCVHIFLDFCVFANAGLNRRNFGHKGTVELGLVAGPSVSLGIRPLLTASIIPAKIGNFGRDLRKCIPY